MVLENFRPGTMERLGFGYDSLPEDEPAARVLLDLGLRRERAPKPHRPGYDLIVQGESGVMDLTGFADGPPVKVGQLHRRPGGRPVRRARITLALLSRARSGKGQKVEIGMLDVMAALLTYQAGLYWNGGGRPARRGNAHPSIVPYEVYQAKDAYLTLGVANNSLCERFCGALGRRSWPGTRASTPRPSAWRTGTRSIPILNAELGTRPAAEWLERCDKAGVPAGKIKTVAEVCESQHLKARGMVVSLPHPKAGAVTMMGVPIRLGDTPGAATIRPAAAGPAHRGDPDRAPSLPARQGGRAARGGSGVGPLWPAAGNLTPLGAFPMMGDP